VPPGTSEENHETVIVYIEPRKCCLLSPSLKFFCLYELWLSRHQDAGQNLNLLIANTAFVNVTEFTYLVSNVTNPNCIDEEIKSTLISRNACYQDHWEDLGIGGRITLRWALGRQGSMGRTGFGWLRIGSSGGIL
jgi:hypothetical protein